MYCVKLTPVTSVILDGETKRRAYGRHLNAVRLAKPHIDATHPVVPQRLIQYNLHSARNRRIQRRFDDQKIDLINEMYIQHIQTATSFHDSTLIEESRLVRKCRRMAQSARVAIVRSPRAGTLAVELPHFEKPPDYNYDGMIVVDDVPMEVHEPELDKEQSAPRRGRRQQVSEEDKQVNEAADEIFKLNEEVLECYSGHDNAEEEEAPKQEQLVAFPI